MNYVTEPCYKENSPKFIYYFILMVENESKVNYNNVKALGMEYGRGQIRNNNLIGPDEIGNSFVQKNLVRGSWANNR